MLLMTRTVDANELAITKSVGSWGNGTTSTDANGKHRLGKYVVPIPCDDPIEKKKIYKAKGFTCDLDFYYAALPAHVQLALRMINRGVLVVPGERIEYVVTDLSKYGEPMGKRYESLKWFKHNANIYDIDYLYYANKLTTAINTVLAAVWKKTEQNNENNKSNEPKECQCVKKCYKCKLLVQFNCELNYCDHFINQMIRKNKLNLELLDLFKSTIQFK